MTEESRKEQLEYTFALYQIPEESRDYYRGLFQDIGSILEAKGKDLEDLEFYVGLAIFSLTDIYFHHKGEVDAVDLVNFYAKCATEAIVEMIMIPEEQGGPTNGED